MEAARRYLAQWWGPDDDQIACPVCKTRKWNLRPAVDLPIRFQFGQVLTLVPVECETCHYVMLFNGVAIGLFGPDGLPTDAPREAGFAGTSSLGGPAPSE